MQKRGKRMMRNFIRLTLITLILATSIGIGYAQQEESTDILEEESISEEVVAEETTEEVFSVFDSFEEKDEEQLLYDIDNGTIKGIAHEGTTYFIVLEDSSKYLVNNVSSDTENFLKLNGYDIKAITTQRAKADNKNTNTNGSFWSTMFSVVVLTIMVYAIVKYMSSGGASFKKRIVTTQGNTTDNQQTTNKDKKEKVPTVKFSDVEGVEELKEDVFRIVDCLKDPEKYEALGARTPKGIILYGPPGTGKTLLAKAIAGEAGVPFLATVGSDFVEKYVGVGAKRVRELYSKAKAKAPCIVFIDEVDAVASKRGDENNSESDQTINALLSELDGFGSNAKIITICATNRLDMLDSAFTRAGRFDLKLAVGLPDKKSRLRILQIHSRNKKLADDISLEQLANKTAGFSGAELEALLNEAAMLAAGQNRNFITMQNIDDAFFKIVMQGNKKKREKITDMNKIVAWHEAGHTLATKLLTEDEVSSVTIIGSSSGAGGVTFRTPKEEGLQSKKYLKASIGIMYAGRIAEELYLGDTELITTGASQDIKQATSIIKQYLALYGMGDIGMLDLTQLRTDFQDIVGEATKLANEIYNSTKKILMENKEILKELAEALLDKETLDEKDINKIILKYKGENTDGSNIRKHNAIVNRRGKQRDKGILQKDGANQTV